MAIVGADMGEVKMIDKIVGWLFVIIFVIGLFVGFYLGQKTGFGNGYLNCLVNLQKQSQVQK